SHLWGETFWLLNSTQQHSTQQLRSRNVQLKFQGGIKGRERRKGSRCRLCPTEWLMHEGKCYWASKESRIWHKSHDDCSAKSSRLLVIQDQKEMVK
uniref:Uncharacterized protein n=1 Tax=Chrysemys picta bellii TaxID=8478 RepID=A0A8C3F748_CHRPI